MVFKHSVNILTSRFSLVYKSLLYVAMIAVIIVALVFSILLPAMSNVIDALNEIGIFKDLGAAITSLFSGDADVMSQSFAQLKVDYHQILEVVNTNSGKMWLGFSLIILIIAIYKFLSTMINLPISDVANNFMNSNSKYGFTSNYIHNFTRSLKYSAIHTLVIIPYMAASIGVIWLFAWLLNKISLLLACMSIYFLVIILIAMKRALFSYWLPLIVVGDKGIIESLKENFKLIRRTFASNFGVYTMVYFLIAAATILIGVVTLGLGIFVVMAAGMVLNQLIDMVNYYRTFRKKYYVDSDTVINSDTPVSDEYR